MSHYIQYEHTAKHLSTTSIKGFPIKLEWLSKDPREPKDCLEFKIENNKAVDKIEVAAT